MNANETLETLVDRETVVGYSYSLYECLTDLLTDIEAMNEANDLDADGLFDRVTVSAMNCLADMDALRLPFEQLVRYRFESTCS